MKKYILLFLGILLFCMVGCKKGASYGDAIYVTGTLSSNNIRFLVDGQSSIGLTVSSTAKAETDIKVKMKLAPELLDQFNASTGRNCQLPPTGSYSLDGSEVVIEAGKAVSTQIGVTANSEQLKEGVAYCVPVSINSVEGGDLGILESSRTAYLMLTKIITVKVASLSNGGCFDIPSFKGEDSPVWALNQMTIEIKTKPTNFGSTMNINPIMGSHESLLLRFGDGSSIPSNKLNFAKVSIGTNYHPDNKPHYETTLNQTFETNTWYHIAVVYDGSKVRFYVNGELEAEKDTQGGQINLAMSYGGHSWDDTFAIGRGYGHNWHYTGCVSECRVWNVARSVTELQDGVCYVDPTSKGLVAYWRFDGETQEDGSVLDVTGHGYNAVPYGAIQWVDNQKCPF